LNALTDEQWNEIFKIRLDQPDVELGRLLVERARETPTHVLPLWLAALVVACGILIGGVKTRSYVRREVRTLTNSKPLCCCIRSDWFASARCWCAKIAGRSNARAKKAVSVLKTSSAKNA
jgi:hypothetical protein